MGGKCAICGYNRCLSALDLHHLNPEEKDFTISYNTNRAWEEVNKEIQKCILVCSNCHREIHEGLITQSLFSSYSEDKAKEITQRIDDLKVHKIFYCKECGVVISNGANYCVECSNKRRQIVERPSREELKNLIRTLPFTEIAKIYNVTDNAIRKWCDYEKLPRRKTDIKKYTDEEWEKI